MVIIATTIGYDGVPHAGGTYMKALCDAMQPVVDLTVLVPGNRINTEAATRAGSPLRVLPLGLEPAASLFGRVTNRVSLNLDMRLRRRDPGMPYLPLLVGLARSREARRALRAADVIDLQWSDSIRLVRLLRWLNPKARIVGTFHDVMSQSFAREPSDSEEGRRYWRGVARRSRRHERLMVAALDEVLVFSDKDAALLGSPPHARVVRPPLAAEHLSPHTVADAAEAVVLVVSFLARDENDKAAQWVLRDVWPEVASRAPGSRLRFVGGGASDALQDLVDQQPTAALAGFVDDIDAEYAAASACLIAVQQGAGVKFKTIEALLHGVPTVTTTVGAEGVGGPECFAGVADDAAGLAESLLHVLSDPDAAQESADVTQAWAWDEFNRTQFTDAVTGAWGLPTHLDLSPGSGHAPS